MPYEHLTIERAHQVATITLNRPDGGVEGAVDVVAGLEPSPTFSVAGG